MTVKENQYDITYEVECLEENFNEKYVGETGCRVSERVIDHDGRDKNFHIFEHSVEREHRPPIHHEFSILGGNYCKNTFRGKVVESLLMKEKRSTHDTQETSIPAKLFN